MVTSVLGALVGLAVNALVPPPLHVRDGKQAVSDVGVEVSDLIRTLALGLRDDWGPDDARSWQRRARALETAVPDGGRDGEHDVVAEALENSVRRRKALARHGGAGDGDWSTEAVLLLAAERARYAILVE